MLGNQMPKGHDFFFLGTEKGPFFLLNVFSHFSIVATHTESFIQRQGKLVLDFLKYETLFSRRLFDQLQILIASVASVV